MSNSNGIDLNILFRRGIKPKRGQKTEMEHINRFWIFVQKSEDCWNWTGNKTVKGSYGAFCCNQRDLRAHVFSYAIAFGGVPKGLCVLHKCDNTACVRPDHLFLGTERDNNRDSMVKGHKRGPKPRYDIGLKATAGNIYLVTKSPMKTAVLTGLPLSCVREIASNHKARVQYLVMIIKNRGTLPPNVMPVEQAQLALADYKDRTLLQAEAIRLEEG